MKTTRRHVKFQSRKRLSVPFRKRYTGSVLHQQLPLIVITYSHFPTALLRDVYIYVLIWICRRKIQIEWNEMICFGPLWHRVHRDHSGYGLSQWETTLYCNVVSHWLSPYPEWSLGLPKNGRGSSFDNDWIEVRIGCRSSEKDCFYIYSYTYSVQSKQIYVFLNHTR